MITVDFNIFNYFVKHIFKILFQEHHQSDKQFGYRSGQWFVGSDLGVAELKDSSWVYVYYSGSDVGAVWPFASGR